MADSSTFIGYVLFRTRYFEVSMRASTYQEALEAIVRLVDPKAVVMDVRVSRDG